MKRFTAVLMAVFMVGLGMAVMSQKAFAEDTMTAPQGAPADAKVEKKAKKGKPVTVKKKHKQEEKKAA